MAEMAFVVNAMEDAAVVQGENRVPRAAFAVMRIFLGAMWLFEALRGAPWALPAAIAGLLLLTGLFTPPAAILGTVVTVIVLMRASSPEAWGTWPWLYWLTALMHMVTALAAAGRVWGIDAILARRKPLWPLW